MPQNRHFTPGPADALFQSACILSASPSRPCWTSPEASYHGGKCTGIAGKPGTFHESGDGRCGERRLWSRCPGKPRGEVHQNRGKSRHFPRGKKRLVRREKAVESVSRQARGESAPKSWEFPALSPGKETAGAVREVCGAGSPASQGWKCTEIAGIPGTFPGVEKTTMACGSLVAGGVCGGGGFGKSCYI